MWKERKVWIIMERPKCNENVNNKWINNNTKETNLATKKRIITMAIRKLDKIKELERLNEGYGVYRQTNLLKCDENRK